MNYLKIVLLFFILIDFTFFSQKGVQLKSPDGNIVFFFKLPENAPVYTARFHRDLIVENSELGLSFKNSGDF